MKSKYLNWLYGELPGLVDAGVLDQAAADRLRGHYGPIGSGNRQLALILSSVLGAALVGLGVILMIAHNWDQLSRSARVALAFAPLVTAQALAGWTLLRRTGSVPWREGSGVFLLAAIGAAIALVSQIYHIPGDMGRFLLTWMLLVLPCVYLLDSSGAALGVMAGWVGWAIHAHSAHGEPLYFLLLMMLLVPHMWIVARRGLYQPRFAMMGWAFAIATAWGILTITGRHDSDLWMVVILSLLAVYYLAGRLWMAETSSLARQPFRGVAVYGIPLVTFILTYEHTWDGVTHIRWDPATALALLLVIAAAAVLGLTLARRRVEGLVMGSAPLWAVAGFGLALWSNSQLLPTLAFNLYALLLGVATLVQGIRVNRLAVVNGGMAILSIWIMLRFFDEDVSFLVRGTVFILLGCAFLYANFKLMRRKESIR